LFASVSKQLFKAQTEFLVGTPEFCALLDKAYMYRTLSRVADNHREHNVLTEQEVADVKAARHAFAETYKSSWEKYNMPSSAE
jgi:hypothetical protein